MKLYFLNNEHEAIVLDLKTHTTEVITLTSTLDSDAEPKIS
jgi:hypothetical protein